MVEGIEITDNGGACVCTVHVKLPAQPKPQSPEAHDPKAQAPK